MSAPPADTEAPSAPTGLDADVDGPDVNLAWDASTDNVGVTGYRVKRGSEFISWWSTDRTFTDAQLAPGTYEYRVVARDAAGNETTSAPVEATVADVTPEVKVVGPYANQTLSTSTFNQGLQASVRDNPGTVSVQYKIDGIDYGAPTTDSPDFARPIIVSALSNGTHVITATATDAAGHVGTSLPVQVTVDNPPAITFGFVSPTDGATVSGSVPLDFDWTGGDANDRLTVRVNGSIWDSGRRKSDPEPEWDTTGLAAGVYTLKADVTRLGSSVATHTIQVTVDNADDVPPSSPSNLQAQVAGRNVTLSWDASTDDVGVTGYRVKRGGEVVRDWETGRTFMDADLAPGTYSYVVEARDAAGNVTASQPAEATVQNNAPVVTIETPYEGVVLSTATLNSDLRATVSNNTGATTVQFKIDGVNYGAPASLAQGGYTRTLIVSQLANGPHVITAVATDSAGNVGTSAPRNVTVDNPPATTFEFVTPVDGATVSGSVALDYTWTGGAPDDRLVLRVNGSVWDSGRRKVDPKPVWNTTSLADGVYTLRADITRLGSQFMSKTIQVTVNNAVATPTPTPTPGLVAAYSFNESSTTSVTDNSGNGRTGTISGATRSASGRNGGALSFDGSNDLVTVPDANALDLSTGMTLEAWVKPSALGTMWRTVLIKERPSGLQYALYAGTDTSRPSANVFTNDEYEARGTAGLTLNAWSHLAATYDGSIVRLYVNGTQVATRTAGGGAMGASTGALKIGGNAIWGEWFSGLIDDVRVYNRALTAPEIAGDSNLAVAGT